MGFFTKRAPSADVIAMEPTRTVSWRDDVLRKLLATNVELRAALQQVVGEDLVVKMKRT
ncbi:popeye domain-containing protein [Labilithrix luteola]|uniref:popeye domain-containing protein n=1 Tax=Labilithrix luteola TaxID=1391654 RepID=UPI001F0B2D0C|nr:popeye domain-containing protein [Labilithrix luteola]